MMKLLFSIQFSLHLFQSPQVLTEMSAYSLMLLNDSEILFFCFLLDETSRKTLPACQGYELGTIAYQGHELTIALCACQRHELGTIDIAIAVITQTQSFYRCSKKIILQNFHSTRQC